MSTPNKVLIRKQPVTDFYENDDVSYDYQEMTSPTGRTQHSTSDVNLIRTRYLDREERSVKTKYSRSTSTRGLLITVSILLALIVLIIAPTVLGVIFTRNPLVVNNSTTTTAATTARNAYWAFDNDPSDMYGVYNGTLINGATYSNTTYFGFNANLYLNASINQSMTISSPFFNLSYTSFTVEAWIYGTTLTGDNAIFSQCQCSSCQDQCLYLIIRNYKMYMGFMLDDVVGLTSLSANTWYHVAYVYDYSSQTQSVYVQGILDSSKSSAGPYQGKNGSIIIGSSQLPSSSFNGLIDNLRLTTRAKSASELLSDATLVAYFSFDGPTLTTDMGPNQMMGTLLNAAVATGRVGQGLAFNGASAYFQAYGFYQLGKSNQPFSFALWIYPYSIVGGTLIHKSVFQTTSATWCQDMMGLTYSGQIHFHTNGANQMITGPFISALQWTHLVYTYSTTNGQTMYINGALYLSTGAISFSSSNNIDWLTIGSNLIGCTPSPILGGYYFGVIDEFYVYRRELSASEVASLANP